MPQRKSKKQKTQDDSDSDDSNEKHAEGTIAYVHLVNFMCHEKLTVMNDTSLIPFMCLD